MKERGVTRRLSEKNIREKIVDTLARVTGITWIIAMNDKGEVWRIVKGITREKAGKLIEPARKAVEVSAELYRIVKYTAAGEKVAPKTLFVRFNGDGIQVESFEDNIYVFSTDYRMVGPVSSMFERLRAGKPLRCQKCGANLTLETYTCPRCGRIVPFTAEECPYCGRRLVNKRCPRCGAVINVRDGSVVPVDKATRFTGLGLAGLIFGVALFTAYSTRFPWPALFFLALGSSAAALLAILGIVESKPHV